MQDAFYALWSVLGLYLVTKYYDRQANEMRLFLSTMAWFLILGLYVIFVE